MLLIRMFLLIKIFWWNLWDWPFNSRTRFLLMCTWIFNLSKSLLLQLSKCLLLKLFYFNFCNITFFWRSACQWFLSLLNLRLLFFFHFLFDFYRRFFHNNRRSRSIDNWLWFLFNWSRWNWFFTRSWWGLNILRSCFFQRWMTWLINLFSNFINFVNLF